MQAKCLSSHSLGDGGFEAFAKEMGDDLSQELVSSRSPEKRTSANEILASVNKRQLGALVNNGVGYEFCRLTGFQTTLL